MVGRIVTIFRSLALFIRFRNATMVRPLAYVHNLLLTKETLETLRLAPGCCIIECGTWRGGMAAGLIAIGGKDRDYYFFDSFAGLPPPDDRDGPEALEWLRNKNGPRYFNNCAASIEEFNEVISRAIDDCSRIHVHAGLFDNTFDAVPLLSVAVLRLDADWYRSTYHSLEKFWDRIVSGGTLILDDYYDWPGCRLAVHDFFAARSIRDPIHESAVGKFAYVRKS